MFNKYNEIVICVGKEYTIDVNHFINNYVKVKGVINIHIDGGKSFIGFKTKTTTKKMVKLIEEKMYKTKVKSIVGGVIFVEM